jgi:vitamin B12 transporter
MYDRKTGGLLPVCLLLLFLFPVLIFGEDVDPYDENDTSYDDLLLLSDDRGITVTAAAETTQQMEIITKEEINRYEAQDLAALLSEALDLGSTRYGGYGNQAGINIRGFDSQRVAILIDGIPANNPQTGEFEMSSLDLNSVDRIEVIYGGSDTKYNVSGALGGVINIITLKNRNPGLSIGAVVSNSSALPGYYVIVGGESGAPQFQDLVDTQGVSLSLGYGIGSNALGANLFFNRAGNHFLYRDFRGVQRRKESNEVMDGGGSLSWVRDVGDYSKIIASGDVYYGDKSIPTSGTTAIAGIERDLTTRQNLMLDMGRIGRDDLETEASVSHSWSPIRYISSAGLESYHNVHSITGINRWGWYPLDVFTFRIGGDYRYITLASTEIGDHDRHDGGVYLTAEYKPLGNMLIIGSAKTVFSSGGSEPVVLIPKLGFVWYASDFLTLKNNYFRSFKYPDFEDLYWAGGGMTGNPDLKSEDGWGGDLTAELHRDYGSLETTFSGQWTRDSVHWSENSGSWRPENVGEAAFFGLDTKLRTAIPLPSELFTELGFSLSYQYLLSYLLSYGYTWESEKRIPYMPAHTLGFSLDLPWTAGAGGSLLVSGHFESSRYTNTSNLSSLASYFLLNINANQNLNKNIKVFVIIHNVLNSQYESYTGYPMPGLTVTAGLRFNFEEKQK